MYNGSTPTFTTNDTYSYDGLGNLLTSSGGWSLPPTAVTYATNNTYNSAGRLSVQTNIYASTARTTAYSYDSAGNTRFEPTSNSGSSSTVEERASFYAGDDKVIAIDRRSSGRQTLEEFRYDALGRRVWVSTNTSCAPTNDIVCITNSVRRIIWDGNQEIAEIQAPLDVNDASIEELDSGFPLLPYGSLPGSATIKDPNPFYGRVVYAPGLAIDQPVSVTRYDYRDDPAGTDSLTWPRMTMMVFWNYRGVPAYGVFDNGAWAKPSAKGPSQGECPVNGTSRRRCVEQQWPFAANAYDKARGKLVNTSWHGSLLRNKQDGTGLEYMRNRVYDPQTGRFTQEDPIGLAGGMNLYGFAGGDPVNFSDPFGLCVAVLDCPLTIGAGIVGGKILFVAGATAVAAGAAYASLKWDEIKRKARSWAGIGGIAAAALLGGEGAAGDAAKAAAQEQKARVEAEQRRREQDKEGRRKRKEGARGAGEPPEPT